jgi:hypothetical protein
MMPVCSVSDIERLVFAFLIVVGGSACGFGIIFFWVFAMDKEKK